MLFYIIVDQNSLNFLRIQTYVDENGSELATLYFRVRQEYTSTIQSLHDVNEFVELVLLVLQNKAQFFKY